MALATKQSDCATQAPPTRRARVFRLALPAVGEQVLNTFVGLSDTFLIGHLSWQAAQQLGYTSTDALNGVGLANQVVGLITVLFSAVGVGATAVIARSRGSKDMDSANLALRQSLLIGLGMGLLSTILMLLLAPATMDMLGAAPEVRPLGVEFLQIAALSFAPAAVLFLATSALRGAGDTKTPLWIMLVVNAINILGSWLLINGNLGAPALGVRGTAIGASAARTVGALILLAILLRSGRGGMRLSFDLRPHVEMIKRILRIGAPSGLEQLVFQGAILIFVRFVTGLGTVAYAAHNVVLNIESLSFLPGFGYAIAASALVGYNLGAGSPADAEADVYEAQIQGTLMMSALGVVMMLFPHQLISLFTPDPAVADAGANAMRLAGLFQPLLAVNFIMSGGLRGAGDTRWPLITKLISTWGVRLPLIMLMLHLGWGLTGVWIGMTCDFGVQATLAWWQFQRGKWKHQRV